MQKTHLLSLSLSLSLSKQVVLFSLMEENALKKPFFRLFGRQQSSSSSRLFEENNTPRANKHTLSLSLSLSLSEEDQAGSHQRVFSQKKEKKNKSYEKNPK